MPEGLKVTNVPFISFVTGDIKISWRNTTKSKEKDLLQTLILGIEDKKNLDVGEVLEWVKGHIQRFGSWRSRWLVFEGFESFG